MYDIPALARLLTRAAEMPHGCLTERFNLVYTYQYMNIYTVYNHIHNVLYIHSVTYIIHTHSTGSKGRICTLLLAGLLEMPHGCLTERFNLVCTAVCTDVCGKMHRGREREMPLRCRNQHTKELQTD